MCPFAPAATVGPTKGLVRISSGDVCGAQWRLHLVHQVLTYSSGGGIFARRHWKYRRHGWWRVTVSMNLRNSSHSLAFLARCAIPT